MAKNDAKPKTQKAPGQFRQLWSMYKLTAKSDRTSVVYAAVALVIPVIIGLALSFITAPGNVLNLVITLITSLMLGVLLAMVVMSRRAERAAYTRIEGQAGAVGAVLSSGLRRNWRGAEMPVAFNPRTREAVYRAIGPGGVVLIGEGTRKGLTTLLEDEKKKIGRVLPGVNIEVLLVNTEPGGVRIFELTRTLYKLKKVLNRSEVSLISKRLAALGINIPVPKGIDPTKVRMQRR
ncbi:DUF4191 domain-containing protein [Rhodoluna sp.]|uniref:DUF4191 domain-containing protein n=1 Tax=Rhodoluna sp. TaxID=1969481 RepID=UPI0025E43E70|nr:DUF4191 domain-containing protein [Rhodoluna sp.]